MRLPYPLPVPLGQTVGGHAVRKDSMSCRCCWRHDVHLRQPQAPEGGLHRSMRANGNYRFDAAHHLVRKSRSATKTAPVERTRRDHAESSRRKRRNEPSWPVPHVSMVRTERPTPPEPTDRPPRSWRAIHRRAIPLTRRCNNHLAAAGTASHNHHVGGSV